MAKIKINGELFEFDGSKKPMSEALAIEQVYGRRYAEWEADVQGGSAKALCAFAWLVWRRNGRDVDFQDILKGEVDFDFGEFLESLAEAGAQQEEGPTTPGESPDPDGTPTTGTAT